MYMLKSSHASVRVLGSPRLQTRTLRRRTILKPKASEDKREKVEYGADWYEQTRAAAQPKRTIRSEIEYRRRANELANNGRERKDLYTPNWDGDQYKGSPFNILTVLTALFFLVPIVGLIFAYFTKGKLWGGFEYYS